MVKRIAKYGGRSGILPKPRQIVPRLKTSWELEKEKELKLGFSDPAMAPKGSHPNPPPKHYPTADEKIAASAKDPKHDKPVNTALQRFKKTSADMRRQYFIDSLKTQEAVEKKKLDRREQMFREAHDLKMKEKENESESNNGIDSDASSSSIAHEGEGSGANSESKLDLPTIESFLDGPFVRRRTPEEQADLLLKRKVNRVMTEIVAAEKKAEYLLEIYQKSESFIINRDQLDQHIARQFAVGNNGRNSLAKDLLSMASDRSTLGTPGLADIDEKRTRELNQLLNGTTSTGGAGLPEVKDALSGETQKWKDELEKL